jgi:hypothetical protein
MMKKIRLFEPDSEPYGVSYAEWTQRWWKWILEQPASTNPAFVEHPTEENQPYDKDGIWFFAGAFNDGSGERKQNIAYRRITIPNHKAILLPVINFFAVVRKPEHEDELNARVKHEMDIISTSNLYLTVDGEPIAREQLIRYRVATPSMFEIMVPGKDNVCGLKHLLGRPIKLWAKGDGYWIFLNPFAGQEPGKHEIHSFGSCLAGRIQIEVNYQLNVIIKS